MLKRERLSIEVDLIKKKGIMTVKELEDALDVSGMTIRRDLDTLADEHQIERVYGGVTSPDYEVSQSSSFRTNSQVNLKEKAVVAIKAAEQIVPGDIVYLGPGTTCELIIDHLPTTDIQIVTSNMAAFNKATALPTPPKIIVIGGEFDANSDSVNGIIAERAVQMMQFDKAFISTIGVSKLSLSTSNSDAAKLQNIVLDNSTKRYVLCDYMKLGKRAFFDFYRLQADDYLITNNELSDEDRDYYSSRVQLLLA
jgi:DeoR family lactose phosphotransferase system repressor